MKNALVTVLLLGSILTLGSINALAEGPCKKDRETYCANVKPGEGKILECMKVHEDKLSSECKAFRAEKKEQFQDMKESCRADAEKLCPGLKRKELQSCMREKRDQVSKDCKAKRKEVREKRRK